MGEDSKKSILSNKEDLEEKIHNYGRRASWYLSTGERTNAENSIKEALELDPNSTTANRNACAFYFTVGETEKALEYHEKEIKLEELSGMCNHPLPKLMEFILKKEYNKIVELGEIYLKKCAENPEEPQYLIKEIEKTLFLYMAIAYRELNDYKRSEYYYKACLKFREEDSDIHYSLAACYFEMIKEKGIKEEDDMREGKEITEKAILHFERVLDLEPHRSDIHEFLVRLYSYFLRINEYYESSTSSSPSPHLLKIYKKLKLHSEIALKYKPDDPFINLALGESLCVLEQPTEGLPYLEKVEKEGMGGFGLKDLDVWYARYSHSLNEAKKYLEKKIKHMEGNHKKVIEQRLEGIKLLKSDYDVILEQTRNWMRKQTINDPNLQEHLENTLKEVIINHPLKDPRYELRIAALLHDIERAFPERFEREEFPPTEEGRKKYKRMHALHSAEIAGELLEDIIYEEFKGELAEHFGVSVMGLCYLLISAHEGVGEHIKHTNIASPQFIKMANLLMLADTLTFFKYDFEEYLKNKDLEAVEEKVNFMFDRIEELDAEVLYLVINRSKKLEKAYREVGYVDKADELQMKIERYDTAIEGMPLYLAKK